jgi:nitrite reductase/ring-hydroxylating ferredoxin subunit
MNYQIKVCVATDDSAIASSVARGLRSNVPAQLVTDPGEADLLVVPADLQSGADLIRTYRELRPDGYILGYLRSMNPTIWQAAQASGVDELCSFGGIAPVIRSLLLRLSQGELVRKVWLCRVSETAGRLGMIANVESPEGDLLLYRISGGVYCVSGRCPHANLSLAEGETEGEVLTCPRHGSQFSLCTGERLRGPSDFGLKSFRVIEENGEFFAVIPRT